jgi:hypothetical protein
LGAFPGSGRSEQNEIELAHVVDTFLVVHKQLYLRKPS